MKRLAVIFTMLLALGAIAFAQKDVEGASFDKIVHDFGTITEKDGALSCVFTVRNTGKDDLVIYAVMTTCGCTDVNWTREAIPAGKSGTISAKYSNDEGPYPFDKTLKVYLSSVQKPIVLHLKGNVVSRKKK